MLVGGNPSDSTGEPIDNQDSVGVYRPLNHVSGWNREAITWWPNGRRRSSVVYFTMYVGLQVGKHGPAIRMRKERRITSMGEECESAAAFDSDERTHPPKHPPTIRHKLGIAAVARCWNGGEINRLLLLLLLTHPNSTYHLSHRTDALHNAQQFHRPSPIHPRIRHLVA